MNTYGYNSLTELLILTFYSNWGLSSVGRAPDLHSGGQEFDSPRLHQPFEKKYKPILKLISEF